MACLLRALLALLLGLAVGAAPREETVIGRHHKHHGRHHHHHRHRHAADGGAAVSNTTSNTLAANMMANSSTNASARTSAKLKTAAVGEAAAHESLVAFAAQNVAPAQANVIAPAAAAGADTAPQAAAAAAASDEQIMQKLEAVERELDTKEHSVQRGSHVKKGQLEVNGPLPADFPSRFAEGVAEATGCSPQDVRVLGAVPMQEAEGHLDEIVFEARDDVVAAVEGQAADPDSKLANGPLRLFLVARDDNLDGSESVEGEPAHKEAPLAPEVGVAMPYGDLEPFGREDTARELTEASIRESDAMVDQLERAEVTEEKRAIFRALTRLRGAAITSYDGIARAQTGSLEEYDRNNHWRKAHPIHHLADEEADVSKWAFPSGTDF